MANEKSRNHEPTGRTTGEKGKAQGKRESDKPEKSGSSANVKSASAKPGPGKQARDQLNTSPRQTK